MEQTQEVQSARDSLVPPKAAFQQLGVGHTKGWELIGAGRLSVVRLGKRCTRIKQSSIDRLISGEAA